MAIFSSSSRSSIHNNYAYERLEGGIRTPTPTTIAGTGTNFGGGPTAKWTWTWKKFIAGAMVVIGLSDLELVWDHLVLVSAGGYPLTVEVIVSSFHCSNPFPTPHC
jgi:hypothetical protein